MKSPATRVGSEPIPGYVLRKRLGAGGYGEVWLADAPGGLQKAVKLVYGTVDQSHAASELKSLDRIRQVNHPFLLSIERIEIVDNQVVIITELAESSLLDRFEYFRRRNEPGIPRTTLLEFLHDTGDGLDFLAQKHSLQHLDVKPGNLLIIADRVKVADFGLVKDLHDQNQSLVSGLTPTYSAPEIFDGRPDYRSDQYSLAIVYMEMLTGVLPFSGKTTGELARQHLSVQPDLNALPPADRNIVARALSKNPLDRFATCRQFVEQLQKIRGAAVPRVKSNTGVEESKTDSTAENAATAVRISTSATQKVKQQFQDALKNDGSGTVNLDPARCMFIGLGGMGCKALSDLRQSLLSNCDSTLAADDHTWLAIDTVKNTLESMTDLDSAARFRSDQVVHLPIYNPKEYRSSDPALFTPLSRRWLYNIPRTLTTEGVRPIAILTLLDHYQSLKSKLRADIEKAIKLQASDTGERQPFTVYIVASSHGGTGSALFSEIGSLVRQLMSDLSFKDYRQCGVLSLATTVNASTANLPSAAALACLSELNHLMSYDHVTPPIYYEDRERAVAADRPFDWVTLVDGGLHGTDEEARAAVCNLSDVILVDSQTSVSAYLSDVRKEASTDAMGWLRTGCASAIAVNERFDRHSISRWCVKEVLGHAERYMLGPRGNATSSTKSSEAAETKDMRGTYSGNIPLTNEAIDEFTRRLLHDLGVLAASSSLVELTGSQAGNTLLSNWARRLSSNPELVTKQLTNDIANWKGTIARIVENRMYNWRQVEQIQLNVIDGVLNYCETRTDELIKLFEPFASMLGSPEEIRVAAVEYLRKFAEEAIKLLDHFRREGKAFGKKLKTWCDSVAAERQRGAGAWEGDVTSLPANMQLLASRVNSILESTLHRQTINILDDALLMLRKKGTGGLPMLPDNLTLPHILSLANDLVLQTANELGIDEDQFDNGKAEETSNTLMLPGLQDYGPSISQSGGKLYRFAVAPSSQIAGLRTALASRKLASSTTVIEGEESLGTYVACDGSHFGVSQTLSRLFRPTPATLQLAERLRTRVDVEWESVTHLFEIIDEGKMDSTNADSANDSNNDADVAPTGVISNLAPSPPSGMPSMT